MECPNCHTQNRLEAKFCQVCGTVLQQNTQIPHLPEGREVSTSSLPVTAPLSTRIDGFHYLPIGGLLDRGRYVVLELRASNDTSNTYLVEDIVPVRKCTQCGNLIRVASARVCVVCGSNLNSAQVVNLHYIVEEKIYNKEFNAEQFFMEMEDQHPGLHLPVAIFTEIPYGQERYYRVLPEYSPTKIRALSEIQELPIVLQWGIILAEALDILHSAFVVPHRVSVDEIVIESERVAWTNLHEAKLISPSERADARTIFQSNVRDLSGILWFLATGQTRTKPFDKVPDAVYKVFSQASKGGMSAKTLATELRNQLEVIRRPESVTLEVGRRTDVGLARSLNEDSLLTMDYAPVYKSISVPIGVYVVADGMGGHAAGDVASRLTCQVLAKRIVSDVMKPASQGELPDNMTHWLIDAFKEANQVIYEERSSAHSDMGNTLVAAAFIGNFAIIGNIGDSRCYHLDQEGITQITTDHSLVERLVETGQITREEAANHPQKNVIYRVVGDQPDIDVDVFEKELNLGEALLLCSDGLSGMVQNTQIYTIWKSSRSPQEACDRLVDAANQAGGEDNITVVIVQILP
jgi:serine/threonine protein phosphatase PrpC